MSLIGTLTIEGKESESKMALELATRQLLPMGKPNYQGIPKYPAISQLISHYGDSMMLKVMIALVMDFCGSVNVVRNMSEAQMIEAASFLLDECGNFRLEDYVIMFTMGKRGQLVKIMDRVDISVISAMLDEYWRLRDEAGKRIQEKEVKDADNEINRCKIIELPQGLHERINFTDWKKDLQGIPDPETIKKPLRTSEEEGSNIAANINYKIVMPKKEQDGKQ